jgi:hypothetical protein
MIDGENYCFCMQCDCSEPQAGSGCGRCLQRKRGGSVEDDLHGRCKQRLLDIGMQQAKEGKVKPLNFNLEEDTDWLEEDSDNVS